mgnify:CR=1 FL=1
MAGIEYFYSAHSAFAYLGSARFLEIAQAAGRTIRHRPMDLDQLMVRIGAVPMAERGPVRRGYFFGREIERWSEERNAPVTATLPAGHRKDQTLPNAVLIAGLQAGRNVDALAHAMLQAHWRDDVDLTEPGNLEPLIRDAGLDPAAGGEGPRALAKLTLAFEAGARAVSPAPPRPSRQPLPQQFVSSDLENVLRQRAFLRLACPEPGSELERALPPFLGQSPASGGYHSLLPLEELRLDQGARPSQALGLRASVLKGVARASGQAAALWRLDPQQVPPSAPLMAALQGSLERWKARAGQHPGVVPPLEAFVAKELGEAPAVYVAYEYFPGAATLQQAFVWPPARNGMVQVLVSEPQLWSFTVQLASALRAVHAEGLAVRPASLAPSKVLLTAQGRVRLNCAGLLGGLVAQPEDAALAAKLQAQDLVALGRLLLCLACGTVATPSLDFLAGRYSAEFCNLTQALLRARQDGGIVDAAQLVRVLGPRAFAEMDRLHLHNDGLMEETAKALENGRLFRVLVRLGFVNERPGDGALGDDWAETGDRYLLKLFRDYVFHNYSPEGVPLVEWGHVVECLNKVDAGVAEKILLMGRDEASMLVVSYADIKRCIESAYHEVQGLAHAEKARARVEEMCQKLLSNPVIESYSIELD